MNGPVVSNKEDKKGKLEKVSRAARDSAGD